MLTEEGIYLKHIDRAKYRKLKAIAAERGIPVYKLLNEAIAGYIVSSKGSIPSGEGVTSLEEVDNAKYREASETPSLKGRWVGIARGTIVATGDDAESVVGRMREAYSKSAFRHGIVTRVGEAREEREWLAGSIQQQ